LAPCQDKPSIAKFFSSEICWQSWLLAVEMEKGITFQFGIYWMHSGHEQQHQGENVARCQDELPTAKIFSSEICRQIQLLAA